MAHRGHLSLCSISRAVLSRLLCGENFGTGLPGEKQVVEPLNLVLDCKTGWLGCLKRGLVFGCKPLQLTFGLHFPKAYCLRKLQMKLLHIWWWHMTSYLYFCLFWLSDFIWTECSQHVRLFHHVRLEHCICMHLCIHNENYANEKRRWVIICWMTHPLLHRFLSNQIPG